MFGLRSSTSDIVYGVIFDIGSESIGISIVESKRAEKTPLTVFSHRVQMRITKQARTPVEHTRQMRESLFSASLIVSREGLEALMLHNKHARIQKILVTCSSPWSYTISRNVQYTGEEDIKVTRELIDDLVKSAETEITAHIQDSKLAYEGEFEVVERATVDVRINDYPIQNPVGLSGASISLAHITGIVPSDIIKAVYEVQEKIFPEVTVHAHTFLLVLYCILRDVFPKTDSLCIIHVTGETTEFGIIEGGTLIESITVDHGSNELIRNLMQKQNRTAVEIASLFELLQAGSLTKTAQEEIVTQLALFTDTLKESLAEHFAARRFPKATFLLAPQQISPLLTKKLAPFIKEAMHNSETVLSLQPEMFQENTSNAPLDINLNIAARFFHKLHGCGEIETH